MSYEGYERRLCTNGHLHVCDCWEWHDESWRCPDCGASTGWSESVDTTNGDGVETTLEILDAHECKCEKCGCTHHSAPVQYRVPNQNPETAKPSVTDADVPKQGQVESEER